MTPRQRQVLDFIEAYIDDHRYAPSVREIMTAVGAKSPSNAHGWIAALIRQGHLRRIAAGARGIELASTVALGDVPFEAMVQELGRRGWFVVNKQSLTAAQINTTQMP